MARQFNGTTQGLSSASAIDLTGTQFLSIGFWLWWDAYATDNDLCLEFTADGTVTAGGFTIDPNAGDGTFFTWCLPDSAANHTGSFARPSAAAWHHYLILFNGSVSPAVTAIYVDGSAVSVTETTTSSVGAFASSTLHVMSRTDSTLFGAGRMADLAIWASLLSSGNATTLAAGARANTVGTPAFYWRIDGTTSPEPATLGGIALNLVASPTFVADPPALSGAAPVLNLSPGRTAWRGAWRGVNRGA